MAKDGVSQFMVNDSPFMDAVDDIEAQIEANRERRGVRDEDDRGEDSGGDNSGDGDGDALRHDGGAEDEDGEEDTSGDSEEGSGSDDEEEEDLDEEDEEEEPEVASYKATLSDGSQIDVGEDATLKLKVDGKYKRVSVKDLTSEYNGRIKYDEQIRRNAEENKNLRQKLSVVESQASRARELTDGFLDGLVRGDLIEAMSLVSEMSNRNEDPEKLLNEALVGIGKAIDELANTDPEEIRRKARAYRIDSETKKKEKKLAEYDRQEAIKEARLEKERLKEEHGLSEDEMRASYEALEGRNAQLKQAGKEEIDFSLTDVATLAIDYRHYSAINEVVENNQLELKDDDINYLVDMAKLKAGRAGRNLSKKDYVQLLSNHVNKEIKNLSRKVGSTKTTPKSKKKGNKPQVKDIRRASQLWDV